jgi:hypothetical protein
MKDQQHPFGQRFAGIKPPLLALQDAPASLRNAFWNIFQGALFPESRGSGYPPSRLCYPADLLNRLAVRKRWIVEDQPTEEWEVRKTLRSWLLQKCEWWELYEFIEDMDRYARLSGEATTQWKRAMDSFLEGEGSPYRFVNGRLAPITSDHEVSAIDTAAGHAKPFDVASAHIRKAVEKFADRIKPDYENAVKEAVSGVESALCVATGKKPGDVAAASAEFTRKFGVHKALMGSASRLFGFGSDAEMVRHGGTTGEPDVTAAEAQLVLISASAWVNYIVRTASPPA